MKKLLVLLSLLFFGAPAYGQQVNNYCHNGGTGLNAWQPCAPANPLSVTGAVTVTGGATAANQTAPFAPVAPATATATQSVLLGCQATSAAINPTTGQQAAIDCDLNNNVLTSPGGAPNLLTSQVSVTTSDTAVASARALRRSITVQNITGTQDVFCSNTTATAGNGVLLTGRGSSFTFSTTSAVRCIAITATQTVGVAETF